MPSTVRFLTMLFWIISISTLTLYLFATLLEPNPREYRHEVFGLTIEE